MYSYSFINGVVRYEKKNSDIHVNYEVSTLSDRRKWWFILYKTVLSIHHTVPVQKLVPTLK